MTTSPDAQITSTVGHFQGEAMRWAKSHDAASATISVELLRAIFDAAGEETVDIAGDIDPAILLDIVGTGSRGAEEPSAWLRLVRRCARGRGLRVRFDIEEPAEVASRTG